MKKAAFKLQSFLVSIAILLAPFITLASPSIARAAPGDVELVVNGDFSSGQTPWFTSGLTATTSGGVLQTSVPSSAVNPFQAIVGQSNIPVASGSRYTLTFQAWASAPKTIRAIVQRNSTPFTGYFNTPVNLTTSPQTFTFTFTSTTTDPVATLQFQLGNGSLYTFNLDNVSLVRQPAAVPTRRGELLRNGTFNGGQVAPWSSSPSVSTAVNFSRLEATVTSGGSTPSSAFVGQSSVPVYVGGSYTLTLKAWASTNVTLNVSLQKDGAPFTQYANTALALTSTPQTFTFTFTTSAEDPAAALQLQMGGQGEFVFYLDTISLVGPLPASLIPTEELLFNNDFSQGFNPWWRTSNVTLDTSSGALQATIGTVGSNTFDAIVGQNSIPMMAGGNYTLTFQAWASRTVPLTVLLQKNATPFTQYFNRRITLTTTPQTFNFTFTSAFEDEAAAFQFQIGGQGSYVFNLDNISLRGPRFRPPAETLTIVRLNQTGYLPGAPKQATVAVEVTSPLAWTLFDNTNTAVATGMTTPFGLDSASGDSVQIADFSAFTTPGEGYTLEAYGERSLPFDIGNGMYQQLKYDALAYYYQSRSGIDITLPFAGEAQWTRPAGHLDVSPNLGDNNVPCFNQIDQNGHQWLGCNYTLDVRKGWYDAGDHGKYVVNGGIAVWTLLNEYERALYAPSANPDAFADGAMNIPENQNGIPDILDEARWELEFMLSMQVPNNGIVEGMRLQGMVHHKAHDVNWTALGLAPNLDPKQRYLYPPSTAATLNVAATGAQCARIWKFIDKPFASRCIRGAELAWKAALAHPAMYAQNNFTGGGPYADSNVSDEFYWAAAELFITTNKPMYLDYLRQSPYFLSIPGAPTNGSEVGTGGSMFWGQTQALGTISLARVPNNLTPAEVATARANIIQVADGYAAAATHEGYGLPFSAGSGRYQWGSNSDVLNNSMVMGLANDFAPQVRYLNAISQGMDYILGRNPNVKSYVSGYGERPIQNPHHRFWAHSLNANLPLPPPGVVSGGPNPGLQDPYIQTIFPNGCIAQKCYADNIESYSTNEVAINWNAPLAWVAAYLDDARAFQTP